MAWKILMDFVLPCKVVGFFSKSKKKKFQFLDSNLKKLH